MTRIVVVVDTGDEIPPPPSRAGRTPYSRMPEVKVTARLRDPDGRLVAEMRQVLEHVLQRFNENGGELDHGLLLEIVTVLAKAEAAEG